MAGETEILAQSNPASATLTDMLTVDRKATLASVWSCNQGSTTALIRVAISPAGAAVVAGHYQLFDKSLPAGRTHVLDFTRGVPLGPGTVIRVRANSSSVSFNAVGG